MTQPETLKSDQPLKRSAGTGTDVWTQFRSCLAGEAARITSVSALRWCTPNQTIPITEFALLP
jgi:hypothetical protein